MIYNRAGQSPLTVEQVTITINAVSKSVTKDLLSVSDKTIYDNYVNFFATDRITSIINAPSDMEATRFTDQGVSDTINVFNYTELDGGKQSDVTSFISMVNSL